MGGIESVCTDHDAGGGFTDSVRLTPAAAGDKSLAPDQFLELGIQSDFNIWYLFHTLEENPIQSEAPFAEVEAQMRLCRLYRIT